MKLNVVSVTGPTASGKTALGIELAKVLKGEVVSCDSMQIYKGMDIASAKPTQQEMDGIPHHLLSFVPIGESYNVTRYVKKAKDIIKHITEKGKLPIIVGGTGLYLDSLLNNVTFNEANNDYDYRNSLYKMAEKKGNEKVYNLLLEIDPDYGKTLHPNNIGRIVRALELFKISGLTMTQQLVISKQTPSPFNAVKLGITFRDRQKLYDKINMRVDIMMKNGLLEEAKEFFKNNNQKTALQAIGIKELKPFLDGNDTLEHCLYKLKQATRHYAKRQLTWFRKDAQIHWLYADEKSPDEMLKEALETVKEGLST